jgi:D-serine deaminase-like pyridoxal phosphate-dependent protein
VSLLAATREAVLHAYGGAIGKPVETLSTPALLLDLPAARRNIARMATGLAAISPTVSVRPHVKTHKSPDLARLQAEAGAAGFSTATVWEAVVLAEAGLDDLFVVNTVEGASKIARLAALARERRVLVAVDNLENAQRLSRAAVAAGATLHVLVEIDTGMRRCGLADPEPAAHLAERVGALSGLAFAGLTGYEGHCSLEDDVTRRGLKQREAMQVLLAAVSAIEAEGIPCPIVSAGGTRTWWLTAATPSITEIQAGTYLLMDQFHSGIVGDFEPALRILATVISRGPDRLILDAGSKAMADADQAAMAGLALPNLGCDEEHARFGLLPDVRLGPGDTVQLLPGYAPSTINLYDAYHVVEDGQVVDIWPIVPRGPGHHGLVAF